MKTIYCIQFPDDTVYIGSTGNLTNRISVHKYSIKCDNKKGKKTYLHFKMEDFGFHNCIFWELENGLNHIDALSCEKKYIEYFGDRAINKSRNPLIQNLGIKRSKECNEKIKRSRAKNMPYFIVSRKTGQNIILTNDYTLASFATKQCRDGLRKKVKGQRSCDKYNYSYVAGGELSQ